jgi:Phage integrase family.
MDFTDEDKLNSYVQKIINSTLPTIEKFLITVLLRNGLRVSEIANPSKILIIDEYRLKIWQWKTKSYREAITAEAHIYTKEIAKSGQLIYWIRHRNYHYRLFKQFGIEFESNRTKNKAITHGARNYLANKIYEETKDFKEVANVLGQKSAKSAEKYVLHRKVEKWRAKDILQSVTGTRSNIRINVKGVVFIRK